MWLFPSVHVCSDAVEAMTRVANYINEMQRVSETYSALFDTILRESGGAEVRTLLLCAVQLSLLDY